MRQTAGHEVPRLRSPNRRAGAQAGEGRCGLSKKYLSSSYGHFCTQHAHPLVTLPRAYAHGSYLASRALWLPPCPGDSDELAGQRHDHGRRVAEVRIARTHPVHGHKLSPLTARGISACGAKPFSKGRQKAPEVTPAGDGDGDAAGGETALSVGAERDESQGSRGASAKRSTPARARATSSSGSSAVHNKTLGSLLRPPLAGRQSFRAESSSLGSALRQPVARWVTTTHPRRHASRTAASLRGAKRAGAAGS